MAVAAAAREEQPLLLRREEGEEEGEEVGWRRRWGSEAGKLAYLALPMVAVSLTNYAVQVSSNMMVGHLPGVLPLSSAAIATSLASVTGFSLLVRTTPQITPPSFSFLIATLICKYYY
jgi:MATE family multidrug resistance protein